MKFAPEKKLDAKALKKAIDDYNLFEPSTTKILKGYRGVIDESDQDDGTRRFSIGTKIYKEFGRYEYSGKVVEYDNERKLYQILYDDGDREAFFHDEV